MTMQPRTGETRQGQRRGSPVGTTQGSLRLGLALWQSLLFSTFNSGVYCSALSGLHTQFVGFDGRFAPQASLF